MLQLVLLVLICVGIGSIIKGIYNNGVQNGRNNGQENVDQDEE